MLKRALVGVIGLCLLGVTGTVLAQHGATIVMRSGERISGELVDYGASGFAVRVNGQSRNIPMGEVASVEFANRGLNADQQAKLAAGQPFVLLADGQVIDGRLFDVGGTTPLRITVDTASGRRDFNSNEIAGIYIASLPGQAAVATSGVQGAAAGALIIPATQQWTPTNIVVRNGETLRFQTSGEILLSGDGNDRAISAGSLNQRYAAGAPIPTALAGALVARINNGRPFAIGNQAEVRMPANGTLWLGINDDNLSDNGGTFQVVVSR